MNIIAVDIGNTNINVGLFPDGKEQFIKTISGQNKDELTELFKSAWEQIPVGLRLGASPRRVVKGIKDKKRNGVIVVSSVKPAWTEVVREIAEQTLGEKILVIGKDIPVPISVWVDEPKKVGTDRILAAAAAYAVVEDAVIVADFGTAVTIDLVDENGAFQGGVIFPGFEISTMALNEHTAQLPKVNVTKPAEPYGKNTNDAINSGVYYAAVAALQEIIRRYAEKIGRWPQTVLTGSAAKLVQGDCEFIDSYVPNLVIKGIVLAYQKYVEEKSGSSDL
jgi:type III pantothenate kinase